MLALQFDVYAMGSSNVARIASRAPQMRRLFLDFESLGFIVATLSEWQAATWVKSRVSGGTKTAGSVAVASLSFLERCTGNASHHGSALVKAQARQGIGPLAAGEPPAPAVPLEWLHIEALEHAIGTARTPQQRAYAGFFTFLIQTAARCMDGQRSRGLRLTVDALAGESMMKGKACWTQWMALRRGFFTDDWATPWLLGLMEEGLPGPDFVLRAANVGLDTWLDRPARYADFSRALHVLLMVYAQAVPETVVTYTPHGCRHVQVTAAQQLAQQKLMTENAVESLGHWERGSKMPKRYDAASGVTELSARKVVSDALRGGWRPAADGQLPASATLPIGLPASSSGSLAMPTPVCTRAPPSPDALAFLADIDHEAENEELEARLRAKTAAAAGVAETSHGVLHTARKRLHLWKPPAQTSVCGWWTCGTISAPCRFAVFDPERRTGVKRCRNCFVG